MLEGQVAPFFFQVYQHLSSFVDLGTFMTILRSYRWLHWVESHLGGTHLILELCSTMGVNSSLHPFPNVVTAFLRFFSGILIMSYHSANYVVVATVLISWCYSGYSRLPLGCRCGQVEPRYWERTLSNNPLKIKRPKTSMIDFKQRLVTMNRYFPKSLRQKGVSQTMMV